jgi:hypothetical protein
MVARIPYERARTLIQGVEDGMRTPTTMSGNTEAIYSYAKKIAWKKDGQWYVVTRDSSRTTNRHISAVMGVLVDPVVVDYDTGQPVQ